MHKILDDFEFHPDPTTGYGLHKSMDEFEFRPDLTSELELVAIE